MSHTKSLRKQLKTAKPENIQTHLEWLREELAKAKNPMVKSSLSQRIRMCEDKLAGKPVFLYP